MVEMRPLCCGFNSFLRAEDFGLFGLFGSAVSDLGGSSILGAGMTPGGGLGPTWGGVGAMRLGSGAISGAGFGSPGVSGSGPGEVIVAPQCGQGPVVGGRSMGTTILPAQWLQRKSFWV